MEAQAAETREFKTADSLVEFVSKWKDALTFVSIVAAISYTVGYAITTTHFQKYHIHNPTLLHGRYLSVGLCFFVIISLTFLPGYHLKSLRGSPTRWFIQRRRHLVERVSGPLERHQPSEEVHELAHEAAAVASAGYQVVLDRWLVRILVFLVSVACSISVLLILSTQLTLEREQFESMRRSSSWFWFYGWRLVFGWYCSVFFLGVVVHELFDGAFRRVRSSGILGVFRFYGAGGLAILLILYASESYASYIYAQINQTWGGGQGIEVRLILDPGLPKPPVIPLEDSARHLSIPVLLLEQTEKTYVVLVYHKDKVDPKRTEFKEAIEIDKTMVKGTLYDYTCAFREPEWNRPTRPCP